MRHLIAVFLMKLAKQFDRTFFFYVYDLAHEIEWKAAAWNLRVKLEKENENYKYINHEFMSISRTAKDIQDRLMEDMK